MPTPLIGFASKAAHVSATRVERPLVTRPGSKPAASSPPKPSSAERDEHGRRDDEYAPHRSAGRQKGHDKNRDREGDHARLRIGEEQAREEQRGERDAGEYAIRLSQTHTTRIASATATWRA